MCDTAMKTTSDYIVPEGPFCPTGNASTDELHTYSELGQSVPSICQARQEYIIVKHQYILTDKNLETMLSRRYYSKTICFKPTVRNYNMLHPPKILESLNNKLHTSPDIEELRAEDAYFDFAINNISNILGTSLESGGFRYHIDIKLRDKGNIHEWERTDIVINIPGEHYYEKNRYWKEISSKVSEFYKSLEDNPMFSEDIINRLRKFIYIVVHAEE